MTGSSPSATASSSSSSGSTARSTFGPDGKIASSGNVIVTHPDQYYYGGAWKMGEGEMVDVWPDYMWVPYSAAALDRAT